MAIYTIKVKDNTEEGKGSNLRVEYRLTLYDKTGKGVKEIQLKQPPTPAEDYFTIQQEIGPEFTHMDIFISGFRQNKNNTPGQFTEEKYIFNAYLIKVPLNGAGQFTKLGFASLSGILTPYSPPFARNIACSAAGELYIEFNDYK